MDLLLNGRISNARSGAEFRWRTPVPERRLRQLMHNAVHALPSSERLCSDRQGVFGLTMIAPRNQWRALATPQPLKFRSTNEAVPQTDEACFRRGWAKAAMQSRL